MDRQFHLRVFFWPFLCLFSSFKHNQLKYVEPNSSQKFLGIFGFQKTSKLSFDRAESQNFHLRTFLYILMQNLKCYLSIGTNLQKNCLKVLPQTYDLFVYCFLPTPLWNRYQGVSIVMLKSCSVISERWSTFLTFTSGTVLINSITESRQSSKQQQLRM